VAIKTDVKATDLINVARGLVEQSLNHEYNRAIVELLNNSLSTDAADAAFFAEIIGLPSAAYDY